MKRKAEPNDDDVEVSSVELSFALPCFITQAQQMKLHNVMDEICGAPVNQIAGHAHWAAENGHKPTWSQADARMLGIATPADAPESGEPTFDDSILYFASSIIAIDAEREARREKNRELRRSHLVWSREGTEHRGKLHNDDSLTLFVIDAAIDHVVLLSGAFVPDAAESAPAQTYPGIQAAKWAAEDYLLAWCQRFAPFIY